MNIFSGLGKSLFVGVISSLAAMAIYFLIDYFWGEPLTKGEQTLITGFIVLLIIIPLTFVVFRRFETTLKNLFRPEIIEETRPQIEKEVLNNIETQTGIVKIFSDFRSCEEEILEQLKTSSTVRIFLQIGKTVLSGTTNFYDYLAEAKLEPRTSIKILHSSIESPYLSEKVAHERSSDYNDWQADLKHAATKVEALSKKERANVSSRQHHEGYIWRLFIFDDYAYVQPYLFKKANSERAPVLKVSKSITFLSQRQEDPISLNCLT